ncbi:MAG: alpha/beta fold hydrolase [Archangium sp.]
MSELSISDVGSGPVVVFAHGTPTWSYEWRHLVDALKSTHRCITVDHLGFGNSPRPADADYSPEAHAGRFATVIEELGLTKYTLVVHDFGGPIALAGDLSKVERLVVFNSFAWPMEGAAARMAGTSLFKWLYRTFNFSFVIAKTAWGDQKTRTKELWDTYTSKFPDADSRERVLFALAKSLSGSAKFFGQLRVRDVPALIVWGMKDNAFTVKDLKKWQQLLPRATTVELPTAGHWPHEEQPAVTVKAVQDFLLKT